MTEQNGKTSHQPYAPKGATGDDDVMITSVLQPLEVSVNMSHVFRPVS
jgi:hypothetical protein